jgi:hypothetical protein
MNPRSDALAGFSSLSHLFMTCSHCQAISPSSMSPTMRPLPLSVWNPLRMVVRVLAIVRRCAACEILRDRADDLGRFLEEDLEQLLVDFRAGRVDELDDLRGRSFRRLFRHELLQGLDDTRIVRERPLP